MKKTFKIIIAAVIVLGLAALSTKMLLTGSYDGTDVRVNIPSGADNVPKLLKDKLGDSFGAKVARLWKLQGGTPGKSHGSYLVATGDDALRVARRIAKGYQTPVRFTFNNVRSMDELAARTADALEISREEFLASVDTFLTARGFSKDEQAAAFIPDTYEFYWTVDPGALLSKLYAAHESFWNNERLKKAERLGLSPTETHTLASIVEGETVKADEKGKIARLYLNRIEKGMPLQADPTVKFALKKFDLRRIGSDALKYDSPFNTYIYKGLPPGPIGIPEKSTLDMVLDAPEHNYLYMCAKPDLSGYHDFAATYDKHRINAARYHRMLDKKGIKN